jgi:RHS repeat-associated protein
VCAPAHGKTILSAEKTALWEKNPAPSGHKLSSELGSPDFAMESGACGYETAMGRAYWISRDPIGERGGKNLYAAASNALIQRLDKLGLIEIFNEKITLRI